MRRLTKLVIVALTVSLYFTFAGTASAGRFGLSEDHFTVVWNDLDFAAGTIACSVTFEGSFHSRTIVKSVGSLIGFITEAEVGPCDAGEARVLKIDLPWHVWYQSFAGRLPLITSIRVAILDVSVLSIQPARCLYRSTPRAAAFATIHRNTGTGVATSIRADETAGLVLFDNSLEDDWFWTCPEVAGFSGTSVSLTPAITVTLI